MSIRISLLGLKVIVGRAVRSRPLGEGRLVARMIARLSNPVELQTIRHRPFHLIEQRIGQLTELPFDLGNTQRR